MQEWKENFWQQLFKTHIQCFSSQETSFMRTEINPNRDTLTTPLPELWVVLSPVALVR